MSTYTSTGLVDLQQRPISHKSYRSKNSKTITLHNAGIKVLKKPQVRKVLLSDSGQYFSTVRFSDQFAFYRYW